MTGCNGGGINLGVGGEDSVLTSVLDLGRTDPVRATANAFNVYDADARRDAVADLADAPFAGEEFSLRTYRALLGSLDGDSIPDALPDPDPTVVAISAKSLGLNGIGEDAQLLVPLLTHEARIVRYEAAMGLRQLHYPPAVPALLGSLIGDPMASGDRARAADEDADVRAAVAEALGQYPESRVFDALVSALDDRDFGVVHAAQRSLNFLTGQTDLPADPARWVAYRNDNPGNLFNSQAAYHYRPYPRPAGFWDKLQFWEDYEVPTQATPADLDEPLAQNG